MQAMKVTVSENGRILIPSELRKELGISAGDSLTIEVRNRELHLVTLKERVARVQKKMKKYFPLGTKLSEVLIAERREAAKHE